MKSLNAISAISLVLIILFLFAPNANAGSPVTMASVQYTSKAPTIDGKKDGCWSKGEEVKMNLFPWRSDVPDESDLSATFIALWDDLRFYCLVMVKDQSLNNNPDLPDWDNDGVEVFFDGDNSKNDGSYDADDDVIRFELWQSPANYYGHINLENISYAYKTTSSGYNLEFSIFFEDLLFKPKNGHEFGFDVQINDNDNGMGRDDILRWWSNYNDSWWNPSLLGTAVLIGKPYEDERLPVRYTSNSPKIDGKKDGLWSKAHDVKMEVFPWRSNVPDESDLSATFITLWDDSRFYCFVTVKDQTLINLPELPDWENDGVEAYFDGDNSKNDGWYDENDDVIRFELGEPPTSSHGHFILDNISYSYKTSSSGYNLEFSIPFNDLQFEPENWHEFGFDMQISDNDNGIGRDDILRWWSDSNDSWWNPSLLGTAFLMGKPRGLGKEMANTDNADISKPERFDLLPNYPNPFNPATNIQYQLPVDATVEILIYNMEGQKIRSLVNEFASVGVHSVEWNGRDDFGKEVASGVYLYRMKAADYVMTRKLMLIR